MASISSSTRSDRAFSLVTSWATAAGAFSAPRRYRSKRMTIPIGAIAEVFTDDRNAIDTCNVIRHSSANTSQTGAAGEMAELRRLTRPFTQVISASATVAIGLPMRADIVTAPI